METKRRPPTHNTPARMGYRVGSERLYPTLCWCEEHTVGVTHQELVGAKTRECSEPQCPAAHAAFEKYHRLP